MRIGRIIKGYNPVFKSIRTDRKYAEELKNGTNPISDNKKENIYAALNRLSLNTDRENISSLLDIAKNIKYGQGGNSEFKDIIDETTTAGVVRENTDWQKQLSETIRAALNSSDDYVSDLENEYEMVFHTKKPLSAEQKDILKKRKKLQSIVIKQGQSLNDSQSLTQSAKVLKNLDYFISSSEISDTQKQKCLELFLEFMSSKYKINPELEDKKLQVVEEMLDDMLIKTPESNVLTTKSVNQKYSGICAAISICRKSAAYEDKVRYIQIVMDELKDCPYMSVYDVTALDSGAKVEIPKAKIDYKSALEQGYRILDASAHLWMQNAHASGDGTIQTENYIAFEPETYGIYDDTSWYQGIEPELGKEKKLLQALIKEKEALDSVLKTRKDIKSANQQIMTVKKDTINTQSKINANIIANLRLLFPDKNEFEINQIRQNLDDFYTGSQGNEANIADKMPEEVKIQVIADFLKTQGNISKDEDLYKSSKVLLQMLISYNDAEKDVKKLKKYNSKSGIYGYYKRLFNLAAAHRLAVISDINLNDGILRFERISGLPTRNRQIINHLKNLKSKMSNEDIRRQFSKTKTAEEITKEIDSDIIKIESVIPHNLDNITQKFFDADVKNLAKRMYENKIEEIKEGNSDIVSDLALFYGIENDKNKVINFLNKQVVKLGNNISEDELQESIRLLGFENSIQMVKVFVYSFISRLQEGISQEEFKQLSEKFGGDEEVALQINSLGKKINNISKIYDGIQKKWNLPCAADEIINKMEKEKSIVSDKKLRILYDKFMSVRSKTSENEKIENTKERNKANADIYDFTNEELEILKQIEKHIPEMKKYCIMQYNNLNKIMSEELEYLYSDIGMLNGQFWVREEGSTGLTSSEQIRILEQMTGKPYHKETDIEEAVNEVKKGIGSGIISYSVDDNSYAFHAQYVPSVTTEEFTNPITKEKELQDVIWTDNSWGKGEKEYYWNGKDGFNYTDYNNGYGWKKGFILADDMKIGHSLDTIKTSYGVDKTDNEKFQLITDMILPGTPVEAYQKLYKMFSYIINMEQNEEFMKQLESVLKSGYKINPRYLEGVDESAEKTVEVLRKKIDGIKSIEDFEKLPKDDYLRFLLELLSLYKSTNNPILADDMLEITTNEELEKEKDALLQDYVDEIGAIFAKSDKCMENLAEACLQNITDVFDRIEKKYKIHFEDEEVSENISKIFFDEEAIKEFDGSLNELRNYLGDQTIKVALEIFDNEQAAKEFIMEVKKIISDKIDTTLVIKDLNSPVLVNSPLHEKIINAVDKYLNPKSDKELLDILIGLQNSNYDEANKFFDILTPEDVGLKFRHPYEYVKKIQQGDSEAYIDFYEVAATNNIMRDFNITASQENEDKDEEETNTPEELYRHLYVKLSELDVQKYIKKYKSEFFEKYKVRQAFPQPVVIDDEKIEETADNLIKYLEESVYDIEGENFVIEVLSEYEDITKYLNSISLYPAIVSRKEYRISDEKSLKEVQKLKEMFTDIIEIVANDSSLNVISDAMKSITEILSASDGIIDCKAAAEKLDIINSTLNITGASMLDSHRKIKQDKLDEIDCYINVFVNSNIDPAYRNLAIEKAHNIIKLLKKNADEESMEVAKDDFMNIAVERHIIKNPQMLLKEWVKLLQEGKSNSTEFATINDYLKEALKVAQQTKIQYKLVQNEHDGISSKTGDLLSMFSVRMNDGSSVSMDSDIGMLYLVNQLKNSNDNNQTLQLFLNQSGLGKKAIKALIDNLKPHSTLKTAIKKGQDVNNYLTELNELNEVISQFMQNSDIKYKSFEEALKQQILFIKRVYKNKNSKIYKEYMHYMESIKISKELKCVSVPMITDVLSAYNEEIVSNITQEVNNRIDFIADLADLLSESINMLYIIDVPENSLEYTMRDSINNECEEIREKIQNILIGITEKIEDMDFLSAQYKS